MKDFYYILGTNNKATPGELNAAYRKLAQKLQPGLQEDDHFLQSHFKEITEAYEILSDPNRRLKYDTALKKNYQKRLYYFKIKHINIAVMLTLVLFTTLFGWYVLKSINGKKTAGTVKVNRPAVYKVKHHKKRHNIKTILTANRPPVVKKDTSNSIKTIPIVTKPPVVKKDTSIRRQVKAATVSNNKPLVEHTAGSKASTTYTAYVRANVTGVIYLHETASYASAVVTKIPNNSAVQVLEKGLGFYKISYNDQIGYVPKWTIPAQ